MAKMKYTGRCHNPKCSKWVDEAMARLCMDWWYYCPSCMNKKRDEERKILDANIEKQAR